MAANDGTSMGKPESLNRRTASTNASSSLGENMVLGSVAFRGSLVHQGEYVAGHVMLLACPAHRHPKCDGSLNGGKTVSLARTGIKVGRTVRGTLQLGRFLRLPHADVECSNRECNGFFDHWISQRILKFKRSYFDSLLALTL